MNRPLLIAALLAASTSFIHLVAGGADIASPLLMADLDRELKFTLYAVWHMATLSLFMSTWVWMVCLFRPPSSSHWRLLASFVATLWLGFGLVFLAIILAYPEQQLLWHLPQWVLLLPTGAFALWGMRHSPMESGAK